MVIIDVVEESPNVTEVRAHDNVVGIVNKGSTCFLVVAIVEDLPLQVVPGHVICGVGNLHLWDFDWWGILVVCMSQPLSGMPVLS